jgi:hypothetical protein
MGQAPPLDELLYHCTGRLSTSNGHGTGFFVAPQRILTCAHVVDPAWTDKTDVTVYWNGQSHIAKIIGFRVDSDLALLEVKLNSHPCVLLNQEVKLFNRLYSYGYPDDYPDGASVTFEFEGWIGEQQEQLKFKLGQVRPGMSGAPLLNWETGGVCGLIQYTRDRSSDLGGEAILTKKVLQEFPELVDQQKTFHQKDDRWQSSLSQQQRDALGLVASSPKPDPTKAFDVFISYALRDEKLKNELEKHLTLIQREGLITTWNTHKIEPGIDQASSISEHLEKASIILLLISADFMASNYRDGVEVERAMEKHRTGKARVVPVILRSADWKTAPFGGLVPLPLDGKPITKWQDRDEAFLEVTKGIRAVVDSMKKKLLSD